MMGNVEAAVAAAERHGADGALMADWGDGGHPNPWIVSLPAVVLLAHRVRGERLSREELANELDKVLGCKSGRALLAYGDIYEKARGEMGNTTELFNLLRQGKSHRRGADVTDETLAAALDQWRTAKGLVDLTGAAEWVRDDFAMLDVLYRAVEMRIREPCKKNFQACFEPEYRRLWLRQNRVGGLAESVRMVFGNQ